MSDLHGAGFFDDYLDDVIPKFSGDNPEVNVKNARWEHRIVAKILNFYNIQSCAKSIVARNRQKTGMSCLTFAEFKQEFPSFPIWLECRKKPNLHLGKIVEIFQLPSGPKKRSKSWMYQLFEDAEVDAPAQYQTNDSNFGVVFELLYAEVGSDLIAYRYNGSLKDPPERTTIIQWWLPHVPTKICVSGFTTFLQRLPWSPSE